MVVNRRITLNTRGNGHIVDITGEVRREISGAGLKNGLAPQHGLSSQSSLG
jgi:thiamine phosphate synthase YjbQ (UPF0047 family)